MNSGRRADIAFWAGKRVLLTGHTGFKGAWAALWLARMGAKVTGFALAPETTPALFSLAEVANDIDSVIGDLRDASAVSDAVAKARPEIVLHMAAQPLVRRSFSAPVETWAANVMGTLHLLEALRLRDGLQAILVVTTDKVYENDESHTAFAEGDRLGGHDPYAASKAAVELLVSSHRASYFAPRRIPLATARGGNVIGGGDFSADRIVPDVWRAISANETVRLRHPGATRPWQHVLDCLAGYLLHLEALAQEPSTPHALNFGPDQSAPISVASLVEAMQAALGTGSGWSRDGGPHPHEMRTLAIDPSRARATLDWRDRLPGRAAIEATAAWYAALCGGENMRARTLREIEDYERL